MVFNFFSTKEEVCLSLGHVSDKTVVQAVEHLIENKVDRETEDNIARKTLDTFPKQVC